MSRSRRVRRTATAAALALALAPALAACGATADAPTLKYYAAADGPVAKQGDIRALNVLVVVPPTAGQPAVMSFTLVNEAAQPDMLSGVTVAGQPAQVTGETQLAPRGSLRVGGPDAKTQVIISSSPKLGTLVPVQIQLQQAGTVDLQVPVVAAGGYYNGYLAPSATTTPAPSSSATPSPSSSGSATPKPAQASPAKSPATGAGSSTSPTPSPSAS